MSESEFAGSRSKTFHHVLLSKNRGWKVQNDGNNLPSISIVYSVLDSESMTFPTPRLYLPERSEGW